MDSSVANVVVDLNFFLLMDGALIVGPGVMYEKMRLLEARCSALQHCPCGELHFRLAWVFSPAIRPRCSVGRVVADRDLFLLI